LLSFYFVENRIRVNRFVLIQPRWRVVAGAVACVLICWSLTSKIFRLQDRISLSVTRDANAWYPNPSVTKASSRQDRCKTEIKKSRIHGVGLKMFLRTACDPAPRQSHQLFVVGDSHADAYARMLYKLADEQGVKVLTYSKAGCSVANLYKSSAATGIECAQFLRTAVEDIKQRAIPGDVVFLAALRMLKLGDQMVSVTESDVLARQNSAQSRAERDDAFTEADELLDAFNQSDLRVILDAPKPVFKSPAFRCSDWFNSANPVCAAGLTMNRGFLLKLRQPIMDSLAVLSAKYPKLIVWDTFPILCPNDLCAAVDRNGPLFFDGDHLSGNGNLVLYPSFLSLLKQSWPLDAQNQS
jgi:hypothetical protein